MSGSAVVLFLNMRVFILFSAFFNANGFSSSSAARAAPMPLDAPITQTRRARQSGIAGFRRSFMAQTPVCGKTA
ncbi:hypothetical protein [Chromobacterium amazonense]|uniref:hypothetical protein n=1 Tax=Chromobacterium amazonense TaxID=1382803 RepID=UPI00237E4F48|nr:hypothetical protein [Chromobacterium amazonense]